MRKMKIGVIAELKTKVQREVTEDEEYAARVRADAEEFAAEESQIVVEDNAVEEKSDTGVYDLIDEVAAGLAQDGRDYIAALCWMATSAGFTAPAISLLLAVAAYEDCKVKNERGCEITDPEMADFKGCSERTIQRWRRQYIKEEKLLRIPFLQITEGDFDRELGVNRPTRYKFLRDLDVADAVLEARQKKLYGEDRRKAIKLSCIKVYDSLAKPLGTAAIRRRKKKSLPPESERKRLLNTIRTSVAKLKELESHLPGGYDGDWEALKKELDAIYNSADPAQVIAEIKDNPMGRQSVAPSIPDVAVSKEMPSNAPLSEYLKVPSIARDVRRRAREHHEGGV